MQLKVIWNWIWRKKIILLAAALICYVLVLLAMGVGGKTYEVRISYIYPGAEDGCYPDGQRLLRDDLIAESCLQEALSAMQAKGWYQDIGMQDIQDSVRVREYLSNPVQEKVESLLEEGEKYTYYNNEFILSFTQPTVLHLKDATDLFGLLREDRSEEFVNELIRSVINHFLKNHTEGDVFSDFADYMEVGEADYEDFVDAYTDKATLCINYLGQKSHNGNTFVSPETGMSFNDLITAYQSLIDVQIGHLLKYTSSERITTSLQEMINKLEVEIDDLRLTEKKHTDEKTIAQTAMLEYDHTFSENIVVVSVNEENGLYQARPKTAYDTVTQQSLDAGVLAATAGNNATKDEMLIEEYSAAMGPEEDVAAKQAVAAEMMEAVTAEYQRLADLSLQTISDYTRVINNNYIETAPVDPDGVDVMRLAQIGVGGVLIAALIACLLIEWHGKAKRQETTQRWRG